MKQQRAANVFVFSVFLMITGVWSQAPRIDQHPNSIIVNVSDPVTLECRASGSPKPTITWLKDGQPLELPLANRYTLIHESNLFIYAASLGKPGNSSGGGKWSAGDAGVYQCRAENENGVVVSGNATISITYLKDDFREVPKSRQVSAGTQVVLDCKAPRGHPEPKIGWEKNGIPVSSTIHPNGSLSIPDVSMSDNGAYVCVAQNHAGTRRSSPAHLTIFEPPKFAHEPRAHSSVSANGRIELACEASGYPRPSIEWRRTAADESSSDGGPVYMLLSERATVRQSPGGGLSTLVIDRVQVDDEGEYVCVAENQIGAVESRSWVSVFERPVFVRRMPNVTVGVENKPLTIECNARGKPTPTIYWAKQQQRGAEGSNNESGEEFTILENGDLYIERLTRKYEGTYLCQARNEHGNIETKTVLKVRPLHFNPPPIISYGPQNQTVPINTKAELECVIADDTDEESKISIKWFKDGKLIQLDSDLTKYRLTETGTLLINSVQISDSGWYQCAASNLHGQTSSLQSYLSVESPMNQNVEFRRNQDASVLPARPDRPVVDKISARTIQLTWSPLSQPSSGVNLPVLSYSIEYYSPEWTMKPMPGWETLAHDIPPPAPGQPVSFVADHLQPDTYYSFVVRARNALGFGPPSLKSDFVRTSAEPVPTPRIKLDQIEKELIGEIIQLNENPQVLSSTSINITWKLFKPSSLLEGFYIKYKPVGSSEYQVDTVSNPTGHRRNHYVLSNLRKFTTYEILVEPYRGHLKASESNVIQAKTREDTPSHSPVGLQIHMDSLTSILIKWQPPPQEHMNGIILGYKVSCLTNETRFNLNLNTNASTRAIILGNLIENMSYCIKVAAYTRVGTGPYTRLECVEMTAAGLAANGAGIDQKPVPDSTSLSKMWLTGAVGVSSLIGLIVVVVVVRAVRRKRDQEAGMIRRKNSSSSKKGFVLASENFTLLNKSANALIQTKFGGETTAGISSGAASSSTAASNHYRLVNDTIWLDTLNSFTNRSHEFPNPVISDANAKFINDYLNQQKSMDMSHHQLRTNSYLSQRGMNPTATLCHVRPVYHLVGSDNSESVDNDGPQYAEIYGDGAKPGVNPYATSGIFLNDPPPHPIHSVRVVGSSHEAHHHQQQTLAKYLLSSQSQSNTPKLLVKNTLHNKVKSVDQHQRLLQMTLDPSTNIMNGNAANGNSFAILNSNPAPPSYYHPKQPNIDFYLTALKHQQHEHHPDDKIRQFVNELLLNQPTPQPIPPQNPPPSLLANSHCHTCSNAQYSSPWNSSLTTKMTSNSNSLVSNLTGNSTLSGRMMASNNNHAMSSSQEDDNVNGESFTSQQYLSDRKHGQSGEAQEYSAITDECVKDVDQSKERCDAENASLYSNQLI